MNFLFHFHQPLYLKEDKIYLPFAFLHAIKDYYDLPFLAKKYNKKLSFNITSTLIEQLKIYESNYKRDYFLTLMLKDVANLTDKEKTYLIKLFDSVNYNFFVKPFERVRELFKKSNLSHQEFLDKEVLFLLSWCGISLKKSSFIQNLINKEKKYTKKDKEELIFYLLDFIKKIIPLLKELLDKKLISLSTTPYSHPILPLLIDFKISGCSLQNYFSLKEDALRQITLAKAIYKDTFKKEVIGMWPSEGAVSNKAIRLFAKSGIKWIATDEILLRKKGIDGNFYEIDNLKIFFRNRKLSDKIGFEYRFWNEEEAARDFLNLATNKDFIILDGENAWEYYKEGGYKFLEQVIKNLDSKTFDELSQNDAKKLKVEISGSWVDGSFNTWACDKYKNRAWKEFFKVRKFANNKKTLILEGSDWYWWYGNTNYTEFKKEFDEIFRDNLKKIYLENKKTYPPYLDYSLEEVEKKEIIVFPKWQFSINVDGREGFFEWIGSGKMNFLKTEMAFDSIVKWVKWVSDGEFIYILTHKDLEVVEEVEFKKDQFLEIKTKLNTLTFKKDNQFQKIYFEVDFDYKKNWFV